jgi:hypothetical protein
MRAWEPMVLRALRRAKREDLREHRPVAPPLRQARDVAVPFTLSPAGRGPLFLPVNHSGLTASEGAAFERKAAAALRTVLSPGFEGPRTTNALARRFLRETLIHSHDVATLANALGVKASRHDLEEERPVAELQRLHEAMARGAVEGIPAGPPPAWVTRMLAEAKRTGAERVDVGKLNPYVLAGLALVRKPEEMGPEYVAARAVHRLALHHTRKEPEMAADVVNSIRMPRVYRPVPMSFAAIRQLVLAKAKLERWSPEQVATAERAVVLQARFERSGRVTSYAHLGAKASGDGWNVP